MGTGGPALMDVQQHSEPVPASKKEEKLPAPQQSPAAQQTSSISDTLRSIPTHALEYAGCKRVFIELEENPQQAAAYAKKYADLVDGIVSTLSGQNLTKNKPQEFISAISSVIYSNLHIVYDISLYIAESLDKNMFDCDTSAFLVFDVAEKMGFDAKLIMLPKHAIAKVEDRYFETTSSSGSNYGELAFVSRYPLVFGVFDTAETAQCMSYRIRGQDLLEQGKYEQAVSAFDKAIAIDSTVIPVHMLKADALQKLGRLEEALASEQNVIDLAPPNSAGDHYLTKGNLLTELGRLSEAVLAYDAALSDPGSDYECILKAHSQKAHALEKQGKHKEALREFDEVANYYTSTSAYYRFSFEGYDLNKGSSFGKADILEKQGKYKEALAIYDSLEPFAYTEKGMFLERIGKPSQAMECYAKNLEKFNGYDNEAFERLTSLLDKYEFPADRLLSIYHLRLNSLGGNSEAGMQAGMLEADLLLKLGRYEEARDLCYDKNLPEFARSAALAETKDNMTNSPEFLLRAALAEIKGNLNLEDALKHLNAALERAGGSFEGSNLSSLHSGLLEAAGKALKSCTQKLKKDKTDWKAQLDAGYLLEISGKLEQAVQAYAKSIALMPKPLPGEDNWDALERIPNAYSHTGDALAKLGKYEEALNAYDAAIAQESSVPTYLKKAAFFEKLGKYDEALKTYNQMLIENNYPVAHSEKLSFLERNGMFDEALKIFDKAAGGLVSPLHKYELLQKAGRMDEAVETCAADLKKYKEGSQEYGELSLKLIDLLVAAGRNDEALQKCDELAKEYSHIDLAIIPILRAELLEKNNRFEDALTAYDNFAAYDPGNSYLCMLKKGEFLERLGRNMEAVAAYDSAIGKNSWSPDAYMHKAQVLEKQGKYAQAQEYYKAAKLREENK